MQSKFLVLIGGSFRAYHFVCGGIYTRCSIICAIESWEFYFRKVGCEPFTSYLAIFVELWLCKLRFCNIMIRATKGLARPDTYGLLRTLCSRNPKRAHTRSVGHIWVIPSNTEKLEDGRSERNNDKGERP